MNRGTDRSPNLDYDNSLSGGAGAPFVGAPHPAGTVQEGTTGRLPAAGNVAGPGQVAPAFNVGRHGGGAPTGLSPVCVPNLGWQGYSVAGAPPAGLWNPFTAGMFCGTLFGPHRVHQVPGSGQAGGAAGGAPGMAGDLAGTGVAAGDRHPPRKRGRPKGRTDQSPRAKSHHRSCVKCRKAGGLLHRTCPGGSGRGTCIQSLPTSGTAQEEETHYVEELAWRERPLPRSITGEETKLSPLPLPPPMAAVRAPSPPTKHCVWSFDEGSRVLEANFRVSGTVLKVTDKDKAFLFKMYERDDISVVTEGLADRCDPYLFSTSYVKDVLGHVRHHKFRLFQTQTPQTDEPHQPTVLPKETVGMHSMTFADYADYLEQRRLAKKRKCPPTEANCAGAAEGAVKKQKCPGTEATCPGAVNGAVNLTDGNENNGAVYLRDEKGEDHKLDVEQDSLVSVLTWFGLPLPVLNAAHPFLSRGTVFSASASIWQYMLDVDVRKLLPDAFKDFDDNFLLRDVLPGGSQCMMNAVNDSGGRPFMGPNLYVTPPSAFTHLHQDGLGTVDSGHLCLSGCNEVVMLRRLTEQRKCHAIQLLTGVDEEVAHSILYGLPHNNESWVRYPCRTLLHSVPRFAISPLTPVGRSRLGARLANEQTNRRVRGHGVSPSMVFLVKWSENADHRI